MTGSSFSFNSVLTKRKLDNLEAESATVTPKKTVKDSNMSGKKKFTSPGKSLLST